MSTNKELELFFKHIQIGLSKYSIKELNEAIISFLSKKSNKNAEIDFVFKIVCEDFNTTTEKLKEKNIRGLNYDAKQIIYCILNLNLGFSVRYIAKFIFDNNHVSVYSGIRRFQNLNMNLKQDRIFKEKYDKYSKSLIEYFANQKELA